jgi:hypothetical protein
MKWYVNTRPSPWDGLTAAVIVVLAILCAVLVWGGGSGGKLTAVVSIDGQTVEEVDLSSGQEESRSYTGQGYTLHVTFCPGGEPGVQVTEADCPTQDCVHTGRISRSGQSIVCLPGRIVIELQGSGGSEDGGVDAVLG